MLCSFPTYMERRDSADFERQYSLLYWHVAFLILNLWKDLLQWKKRSIEGYKSLWLGDSSVSFTNNSLNCSEEQQNNKQFKMMNLSKAFKTVAKALSAHGIWGFGDIGREEEFRINGGSSWVPGPSGTHTTHHIKDNTNDTSPDDPAWLSKSQDDEN